MKEREIVAVKRDAERPRSILDLFRRRPDLGEVSYSVAPPPAAPSLSDLRRDARRRTRLRAGKILDRANRFLMDATIIDRSLGGFRLRLSRDGAVPEIFHLYDEECGVIFAARQIWRRQGVIGARFRPGGPVTATPRELASLRGKFYAMPD